MNEKTKKWFLWSNVILMALSFSVIIADEITDSNLVKYIFTFSEELLVLSISNIVLVIASKFERNTWFKRIVKILSFLLPVCLFILLAPKELIYVSSNLGTFLLSLGIIISTIATLIYVYVLCKPESILGLIFMIAYVILNLVLKQIYKQTPEDAIIIGLLLIGPGMNMFGSRMLLDISINKYLKTIAFMAGLLILFVSLEMIWLSPTRTSIILTISTFLIFLLTLIVLLTIPGSGYFDWNIIHKRIFKKLLLPWIFIILIVSVHYIFPQLNKLFFREMPNEYQEFFMRDYQIENKNGLEPE